MKSAHMLAKKSCWCNTENEYGSGRTQHIRTNSRCTQKNCEKKIKIFFLELTLCVSVDNQLAKFFESELTFEKIDEL